MVVIASRVLGEIAHAHLGHELDVAEVLVVAAVLGRLELDVHEIVLVVGVDAAVAVRHDLAAYAVGHRLIARVLEPGAAVLAPQALRQARRVRDTVADVAARLGHELARLQLEQVVDVVRMLRVDLEELIGAADDAGARRIRMRLDR